MPSLIARPLEGLPYFLPRLIFPLFTWQLFEKEFPALRLQLPSQAVRNERKPNIKSFLKFPKRRKSSRTALLPIAWCIRTSQDTRSKIALNIAIHKFVESTCIVRLNIKASRIEYPIRNGKLFQSIEVGSKSKRTASNINRGLVPQLRFN